MPGATWRHTALLRPASGLTFKFRSDFPRRAASQHEVCAGDGSGFHYQAQQATSCAAVERVLVSARLLSPERAVHCRFQLANCGELAARLNFLTIRGQPHGDLPPRIEPADSLPHGQECPVSALWRSSRGDPSIPFPLFFSAPPWYGFLLNSCVGAS